MQKARYYVILLAIVVLAAILRLYQLDIHPEHFDQDESVVAYDAWSIWRTGADHHGSFLPSHFRAFNEYLPGLAQYITAPFVGILGLDEFSSRLPFALMGVATVFLTASLGRSWFGEKAGLLAALLLATEPWHLTFSRLALTNSIVPFFTVVALYLFTRAAKVLSSATKPWSRVALGWVMLSAFSFALLTRTYQPLKIEAPILFIGCLVAFLPFLRRHWRILLAWRALYVIFTSPQWIDQLVHWNLFQSQFNHNNILTMPDWPLVFLGHYSSQYNPINLFISGFGGGQSIHPTGIGQLFWLEGLLWIAAVVGILRKKGLEFTGFNLTVLIGWGFFTWPLAAALTVTGIPTETRTVNFLPLPELLAAYGAVVIFDMLRAKQGRLRSVGTYSLVAATAIIYLVFNVYFLANFFATPILERNDIAQNVAPYNSGLATLLKAVSAQSTDCYTIRVEHQNQAYIYYLFFSQYPPEKFQKAELFETPAPPDDFNYIPWFNNVRFVNRNDLLHPNNFKYPTPPLCPNTDAHYTFMIRRQEFISPDWTEVAASRTKGGNVLWVAYRSTSPQ